MFVDLLNAKSEALASVKKFVLSVWTPKKVRQDNAKEVFLGAVQDVLFRCRHSTGEDHTRDATQNELAERCNRTLQEKARSLLIDSSLPKIM